MQEVVLCLGESTFREGIVDDVGVQSFEEMQNFTIGGISITLSAGPPISPPFSSALECGVRDRQRSRCQKGDPYRGLDAGCYKVQITRARQLGQGGFGSGREIGEYFQDNNRIRKRQMWLVWYSRTRRRAC